MATERDAEDLRRSSLEHLWMSSGDWVTMAEEGGPTIVTGGNGIKFTDSEGNTRIDGLAGYGSVAIGYGRTEIADAVREQMQRLTYFPEGTTTEPMIRLAAKLAELTPGSLERTWAVTGGSEANETAVKIVRAYHKRNGEPGRYKIVSRRNSGHGATGGVMFLGGNMTYPKLDFEPSYPGYIYAPQPDYMRCELGGKTPSECAVRCAQAVEDLILFHGPDTVAAFIGEPVGVFDRGAMVPGDEYWPMIREICDRYGVLLIADEVATGFGRTGRWFGIEHWGVVPDVMSVAKGVVSSYVPFAATIATKEVADAFAGEQNIFRHELTNGGHPVSAAAALKNIEIMEDERLVENSAEVGAYFREQLRSLRDDHPIVGGVRGLGLLIVFDLVRDRATNEDYPPEANIGERLTEKVLARGLHLMCNDTCVRIAPPISITRSEVDEMVDAFDGALGELEAELSASG